MMLYSFGYIHTGGVVNMVVPGGPAFKQHGKSGKV
jgi:hypothetical protein